MDHEIIIVGGGAGGLELAARLGRALGRVEGPQRILLVDRTIFHLWKPSLHEVAAGSLDSRQEGLSYPLLARRNHFSFALGDLTGLDTAQKRLQLAEIMDDDGRILIPPRTLEYRRLILAIGSGSNLFDVPGAAKHAHLLENVADAEAFNRRLTSAFLASAYASGERLDITIVGAGATGVELSTELIEGHRALSASLNTHQRFTLGVTVIEAGPRILASLSETVAAKAAQELERRGVTLSVNTKVDEVMAEGLQTSGGWIRSDLTVWAAGVLASAHNRGFGLETNRLNQFVVNDRLKTSTPEVYALGDCAQAPWRGGFVPARAQAAAQQAKYLAHVLLKEGDPGPFAYRDRGSLVSLGRKGGVGSLMGGLAGPNFLIEGWLARQAYVGLHLDHYRTVIGLRRTSLLALSRLLMRRVSGQLKLH